jgi:dTMP kinase
LSIARGKFISIEGGEGVGKSSFLSNISKVLKARGINLVQTREPGGTPAANKIREIFNHPPKEDSLTMETEAFLVSAARAQHCGKLISPALDRGDWVLTDRFADSTRAYQGILGGLNKEFLENLISSSTQGTQPDITFLLDCPVEISLDRLGQRTDAKTRYDNASIDDHNKLRQAFLEIAKEHPNRFAIIDASHTAEAVASAAIKELDIRFEG